MQQRHVHERFGRADVRSAEVDIFEQYASAQNAEIPSTKRITLFEDWRRSCDQMAKRLADAASH